MQVQIFTIPVFENQKELEDLNRFLRGRKVISVEEAFIVSGVESCWSYSVKYIESVVTPSFSLRGKKQKIDYKEELVVENLNS